MCWATLGGRPSAQCCEKKRAKREGKRAANHVHCLAFGTVLVGVLTVFRLWE